MPLLPSCVLASSHLQQMIQIDVTEHRLREPWRVIEKLPPSILLSKLGHDLQMLYTKTTKDVAALRRNTLEQWHMLAQNIVRCFQGRTGRLFVLLACVPCYLTFSSHPHPLRVPLCLSLSLSLFFFFFFKIGWFAFIHVVTGRAFLPASRARATDGDLCR